LYVNLEERGRLAEALEHRVFHMTDGDAPGYVYAGADGVEVRYSPGGRPGEWYCALDDLLAALPQAAQVDALWARFPLIETDAGPDMHDCAAARAWLTAAMPGMLDTTRWPQVLD
jgi:hypothetical protein